LLEGLDVRLELIIVVDEIPASVLVIGQKRVDDCLGGVRNALDFVKGTALERWDGLARIGQPVDQSGGTLRALRPGEVVTLGTTDMHDPVSVAKLIDVKSAIPEQDR
jgi:hypothetical protein